VLPIAFAPPGFGFRGDAGRIGPTKVLLVDEISTGLDISATFRRFLLMKNGGSVHPPAAFISATFRILKCQQQIVHLG